MKVLLVIFLFLSIRLDHFQEENLHSFVCCVWCLFFEFSPSLPLVSFPLVSLLSIHYSTTPFRSVRMLDFLLWMMFDHSPILISEFPFFPVRTKLRTAPFEFVQNVPKSSRESSKAIKTLSEFENGWSIEFHIRFIEYYRVLRARKVDYASKAKLAKKTDLIGRK